MTDQERIDRLIAELEYFRGVVREQQLIIRQLTGEKLEVIYIHPADMSVLLNSQNCRIDVFVEEDDKIYEMFYKNKSQKFKVSAQIPAVSLT